MFSFSSRFYKTRDNIEWDCTSNKFLGFAASIRNGEKTTTKIVCSVYFLYFSTCSHLVWKQYCDRTKWVKLCRSFGWDNSRIAWKCRVNTLNMSKNYSNKIQEFCKKKNSEKNLFWNLVLAAICGKVSKPIFYMTCSRYNE